MRTRTLGLTFGLSLGVVACGSNNKNTTADAPDQVQVDSASADAPAAHVFKGYDADESGEVKIEYLAFVGGTAGGRAQRFVEKSPGTPGYHPFPLVGACTNTSRDQGLFPTAQNADRVYADPGIVIISNPSETSPSPTMTLLPNAAAGLDSVGRSHPAGMYTLQDAAGGPFTGSSTSGTAYFPPKTLYDVTFTGSTDLPAQTFKGALWMPNTMTPVTPPMGSYPLAAGTDQTVTMTVPADETGLPGPDATCTGNCTPVVKRAVAFGGGAPGTTDLCFEPEGTAAVTITAASADHTRAMYPTGGSMARMDTVHIVKELTDYNGPTGRRVDFIAQWCNATAFTVP